MIPKRNFKWDELTTEQQDEVVRMMEGAVTPKTNIRILNFAQVNKAGYDKWNVRHKGKLKVMDGRTLRMQLDGKGTFYPPNRRRR